jgi:hypothetical protein
MPPVLHQGDGLHPQRRPHRPGLFVNVLSGGIDPCFVHLPTGWERVVSVLTFDQARANLREAVREMGSSTSLSMRNAVEDRYSQAYQREVRAGRRPQIRKKYR